MPAAFCWLLYSAKDLAVNGDFAALVRRQGEKRGLLIEPVTLEELRLGVHADGTPFCLRNHVPDRPSMVLSRQRHTLVSRHFEAMGVPVYNNARVCELCNDKRQTHQFLRGLPMPETLFLRPDQVSPPAGLRYPLVLKPACSHGGDRVTLVRDAEEWRLAASGILPEPAVQQSVVSDAGRDLRVYVVFGQIVAGVMRTAREGIVSNFKLGGRAELHVLTPAERSLTQRVIRRFEEAGAPLCLAGVDMLYEHGQPVVGEVEDVVGSRMLYQASNIDIVSLFLDGICDHLSKEK